MVNKSIYPITNPAYKFNPIDFPSVEGYLIVGKKDNKAVINHFGEVFMFHDKAIDWYKKEGVEVVKVYIGGQILKIAKLRDMFNQKPIDKAIGGLERELLL
jgi:hypothetical protein